MGDPDPTDASESLEARMSRASARVEALESFATETSRLRRLLDQAREGDASRSESLAEDLETRLRLAEEELKDLAGAYFQAPRVPDGAPLSADALRQAVVEETSALVRGALQSGAFQEMLGAQLESRLAKLEAQLAREGRDEELDNENLERQIASVEAGLGALQDRLQGLESRPPAASDPAAVEAAVRKAGEVLDTQLSERLAGLLAGQAPAAQGPDPAAFLQQIKDMVQQAVGDAFPLDELGRIIDQKVAKRSEVMHAELREVESALVKAIMQQLEAKPLGEVQVTALVDQRINQLLLKYIQP